MEAGAGRNSLHVLRRCEVSRARGLCVESVCVLNPAHWLGQVAAWSVLFHQRAADRGISEKVAGAGQLLFHPFFLISVFAQSVQLRHYNRVCKTPA